MKEPQPFSGYRIKAIEGIDVASVDESIKERRWAVWTSPVFWGHKFKAFREIDFDDAPHFVVHRLWYIIRVRSDTK